jgi:hypothetical protein
MEINPISFDYEDVVSALENPFIRSLSPIEYGKAVQTAVEEYVGYNVNLIAEEDLLVDVAKDPELMVEYQYANNGPGFDRLHLATKKKIQIKLRQVNGKTPFSKQVHFENTRRNSAKNQNSSAISGYVRYTVSEFDYVLVVLCHIVNGERKDHKDWSYALINSAELEDGNNKGYCFPHIPSDVISKNYCENIRTLVERIKQIS